MKKLGLFILGILAIGCQESKEEGYSIIADASEFEDGTSVYINVISDASRPTIIDSTLIQDGKFKFSLPDTQTLDFNYITFADTQGEVVFLPENTLINMTIYKDSLRSSFVEGGPENEIFFSYLNKLSKLTKKAQKLGIDYHVASKLGETEKVKQLGKEQVAIAKEQNEFREEMVIKYPNSVVSVMALLDLLNLRGIKPQKAKEYFSKVDDSLKFSRLGKNLSNKITVSIGTMTVGKEASYFSAPTPDGKMLSLKDAMGKVTIIDFWASWCKPCRIENPNVVRLYDKYHKKGLNIVGVSLDLEKEQWIKAIEQDKLEWDHVSNLEFWQDPVARAYNIRSIPATFVLDEKGIIIAKNLHGPSLELKIEELLGAESTL